MERFLASLMEKMTKTEGKFENEKNLKRRRRYLLPLRIELKFFRNGRGG